MIYLEIDPLLTKQKFFDLLLSEQPFLSAEKKRVDCKEDGANAAATNGAVEVHGENPCRSPTNTHLSTLIFLGVFPGTVL